jgi:RimJ/RimL family protein N-acetyltransferase
VRPWSSDDAPDLVRCCNDPEIRRWLPAIPIPYTGDDAAIFLNDADALLEHDMMRLAIADASTFALRGSLGLRILSPGVAQTGYWVDPLARGRGIASRALALAAAHALRTFPIQRLQRYTGVDNLASQRVAEWAGGRRMKPPGDRRSAPGDRAVRLGRVGGGSGVGFLESLIGDSMRLGGSAQVGYLGRHSVRFGDRRQHANRGLAAGQLLTDSVTVFPVKSKPLVVKRAQESAADDANAKADGSEERKGKADARTLTHAALANLLNVNLAPLVQHEHTDRVPARQPRVFQRQSRCVGGRFVLEDSQYDDLVRHHRFLSLGGSTPTESPANHDRPRRRAAHAQCRRTTPLGPHPKWVKLVSASR